MNIADTYREHFRKLIGVLRRRGRQPADAQDGVQESFVRLLTYIQRGKKVTNPLAFLRRVALNVAVDDHRRERKEQEAERSIEDMLRLAEPLSPDEAADTDERLAYAEKLLETVDERVRDVFLLDCMGVTHTNIAKQFGISTDTVARDIAKANRALTLDKQSSSPI